MLPRILFVDDEPNILSAFKRQLRGMYSIYTAGSGQEALEIVAVNETFQVIVSDFRMPGMDGVEFLSHTREYSPDSARVLLTGHADLTTAIDAVNKGYIFRFLTKPCPPEPLIEAIKMGLEQYRLITAERELLEKTLSKSVNLLTEILSLASPSAFSRAIRTRRIVGRTVNNLRLQNAWIFELAALLSQVGCVALPPALLEKAAAGQNLTENEARLFESHPIIGYRLIKDIPRLETIASIIKDQNRPFSSFPEQSNIRLIPEEELGAQVLKVALDYDRHVQGAMEHILTTRMMAMESGMYNPDILKALGEETIITDNWSSKMVESETLELGMIINEDIYTKTGNLVIPKGNDVTALVLERIQIESKGAGIVEPFRVLFQPVLPDEPSELDDEMDS